LKDLLKDYQNKNNVSDIITLDEAIKVIREILIDIK
jgi:hypothetical protein